MPSKGKRIKAKAVDLADFLAAQELTANASASAAPAGFSIKTSYVESTRNFEQVRVAKTVMLPTAPQASRGIDLSTVPECPPFTAQLRNLPYHFTEEKIRELLVDLSVERITLPMDADETSNRGYAYVDLGSRADLIEVLEMNGITLGVSNNRTLQVSVASQAGRSGTDRYEARRPGGPRGGGGGDSEFESREQQVSDWRRAPRLTPTDTPSSTLGRRSGGGSMMPPQFSRMDTFDRSQMRQARPSPSSDSNSLPRSRPKLELSKRTVPLDQRDADGPASSTSSSIFGGAHPVDTRQKQEEIEAKWNAAGKVDVRTDGDNDDASSNASSSDNKGPRSSIFGQAKPVDTMAREAKILLLQSERDQLGGPRSKATATDDANDGEVGSNGSNSSRHSSADRQGAKQSNVFGSARPVDTSQKDAEMMAKAERVRNEWRARGAEAASSPKSDDIVVDQPTKPTRTSIFGEAKPVDTTSRERELAEKLDVTKTYTSAAASKNRNRPAVANDQTRADRRAQPSASSATAHPTSTKRGPPVVTQSTPATSAEPVTGVANKFSLLLSTENEDDESTTSDTAAEDEDDDQPIEGVVTAAGNSGGIVA